MSEVENAQMLKNTLGFTLVEIIFATVVLTVGLLALVSTMALTTGMIAEARRLGQVSAFANERLEAFRSDGCESGFQMEEMGGLVAYSSVYPISGAAGRELSLVITSPSARGERADTFATVLFCPA